MAFPHDALRLGLNHVLAGGHRPQGVQQVLPGGIPQDLGRGLGIHAAFLRIDPARALVGQILQGIGAELLNQGLLVELDRRSILQAAVPEHTEGPLILVGIHEGRHLFTGGGQLVLPPLELRPVCLLIHLIFDNGLGRAPFLPSQLAVGVELLRGHPSPIR